MPKRRALPLCRLPFASVAIRIADDSIHVGLGVVGSDVAGVESGDRVASFENAIDRLVAWEHLGIESLGNGPTLVNHSSPWFGNSILPVEEIDADEYGGRSLRLLGDIEMKMKRRPTGQRSEVDLDHLLDGFAIEGVSALFNHFGALDVKVGRRLAVDMLGKEGENFRASFWFQSWGVSTLLPSTIRNGSGRV